MKWTIGLTLACLVGLGSHAHAADKVTYEQHVQPILREHCAACHSQDDATSGFAADDYDALLAGGAGGDVLAAGDPDGSRLWRLVTHAEKPVMPPGDKLPAEQLATLKAWITGGLLRNAGSKPLPMKKSAIAAIDPAKLGKPVGEPAMPAGLFRQPVVSSPTVGPVSALAASPWAPVIATPWQRQVSLHHATTHRLLGVIPYLEGTPRVVRFSRDGSLLLVAGGEDAARGTAALFDVKTGARVATIGDELDIVLAADISPDNALVAIGGPKKKVRVYHTDSRELAYACTKHTDWITSVAFSPDGKLLASADRSAGLRLWQAQRGFERADLRGHKETITSLAWRRDGGVLASASEDDTVRLWKPNGDSIKSFNAHGGGVMSVDFAADGRIVTTGRDQRIKLWKPDGGGLGELAKTKDIALAAVFSHDGSQVVAADWTGMVQVIEVASKKRLGKLTANPPTLEHRLEKTLKTVAEREQEASHAQAELAKAEQQLDRGVAAHAKHDAELADARLALSDAEAALSDAKQKLAEHEKIVQQKQADQKTAEQALAVINKQLVTATNNTEEAPSEETPNNEGRKQLTQKQRIARIAFDEATKAAVEAAGLRDGAKQTIAPLQKEFAKVEAQLAKISNQTAGLPKLEQLEANAKLRHQAAEQSKKSLATAHRRREKLAAELERYRTAAERLEAERQQAAEQLVARQSAAEKATAEQEQAAAEKKSIDRQLGQLKQELAQLSKRLEQLKAKASKRGAVVSQAESLAAQKSAELADAERRVQLLESQLSDLAAVESWRQKRAGE